MMIMMVVEVVVAVTDKTQMRQQHHDYHHHQQHNTQNNYKTRNEKDVNKEKSMSSATMIMTCIVAGVAISVYYVYLFVVKGLLCSLDYQQCYQRKMYMSNSTFVEDHHPLGEAEAKRKFCTKVSR